ncbi:glycoside hydrolase 43 family protein [bacterium]|nr:glycoside hydrolase 43 family protein [bacterium]
MKFSMTFILIFISFAVYPEKWNPERGDGTYQNPIIFADYSDPDVIRVDEDYFMVASSFNCMPGIPVLHSKDLVNWKLIGHVYDRLPFEKYNKPVHGQGSWAPSIRYHDNDFYVYFCTPHEGLFMAKAENPGGPWELHHVAEVEMWEDPCPLWDEDGSAYLIRSKLCGQPMIIHRMSKDGKTLLDNGTVVFDDQESQPILEGPKFLKKDGCYYILAAAGGVPMGWQTVLRSKSIYGPYDTRIVLHQGDTEINGPHQGGLVNTKNGEWWFVHFQDRGAYGRVVHLQPVCWADGWPLMGVDQNGDGIGEPVMIYQKPNVRQNASVMIPQTSDEFESSLLGLQWQWHANFQDTWYSVTENPGYLRLYAVQNVSQNGNLWFVPSLLMQKFPSPVFQAKTQLKFYPDLSGEKCGLVIMGDSWAFAALENMESGICLNMYKGAFHQCNDQTRLIESLPIHKNTIQLKVDVDEQAICIFSYSLNGKHFQSVGDPFRAQKGRWIGAKVGVFCINPNIRDSGGYVDVDWFRIQ